MPHPQSLDDFPRLTDASRPLLDVRSPGEFARGHIPGAISFPVFTDVERAEVGTAYKQQGRTAAVQLGLERVGPRLHTMVAEASALAVDGQLSVYCWRGGMRSGAVAWLLEQSGLRVHRLPGGYKAWRNRGLAALSQSRPLVVVGGMTGSAKTDALHALAERGEQVLDLEALAGHRGSAFGAIGLPPQPTQEHFENLLAEAWQSFDLARQVWVEDESRLIGSIRLPESLWAHMSTAPLLVLELPAAARIDYLMSNYGLLDPAALADSITRLRKRMGGGANQAALAALTEGDLRTTCTILLDYYDRAYRHGLASRPSQSQHTVSAPRAVGAELAECLLLALPSLPLNLSA
jgi:tRNA 2-selenouridine synthase